MVIIVSLTSFNVTHSYVLYPLRDSNMHVVTTSCQDANHDRIAICIYEYCYLEVSDGKDRQCNKGSAGFLLPLILLVTTSVPVHNYFLTRNDEL
jgi:hypothetical protein